MDNLLKAREEILTSVQGLTDDQLNETVMEGSWSVAQVLEHLYLMEENVVRQIQFALQQEKFKAPEAFLVHLVADRTKKVSAPEFLTPSNEFLTLENLKGKLGSSRRALEKIIEETNEEELNQKTLEHRRFGVLTLKQWIELVGYHEQRHLGQIEELKEKLVNN
ncbi:MAG TPA: DinB family protein [Ureibacillus sp.]|nr:DinB family protein [Ureibacillus sp.]